MKHGRRPALKPTVGITLGCPCGIGPEIVAAALGNRAVRAALTPVVFGDEALFQQHPTLRALSEATVETVERGVGARVVVSRLRASQRRPGKPGRAAGQAQLDYIEAAVLAAKRGALDALCTAPVSKEQIARTGFPFTGHTELLAERFGRDVLMLMDGPRLRVALATNHLPLSQVPAALNRPRLVQQLQLLSRSLRPMVGGKPRIVVCGLNPHAGDGGLLGHEEAQILLPAIQEARRRGVDCRGPLPADGLFAQLASGAARDDVALAMFHDQGLVAVKALDFVHTVNVTLGLPLPRTSPDHGTAYDIAGKGLASPAPMVQSLLRAAQLVPTEHSRRKS